MPPPPPPGESSLWTGGPLPYSPVSPGSAQCQAQRSHSTNACSSSDLTQLARQLTEKQMSVFLLLCDYSQDNIVPATDFHTDLRFVAIHPTHICIGVGRAPWGQCFLQFPYRFRESGPPESFVHIFASKQEVKRQREMKAIPVSTRSETTFLATLSPTGRILASAYQWRERGLQSDGP